MEKCELLCPTGKADSRTAVDSILFFLCSWLSLLEWMCSSVLSLRAKRLAADSIAAVSNSIANRTPDTRTIRIHTPNYQLIPLLPFESGHLPEIDRGSYSRYATSPSCWLSSFQTKAYRKLPANSFYCINRGYYHLHRLLKEFSSYWGRSAIGFKMNLRCRWIPINPFRTILFFIIGFIWLTSWTTSSWLWAFSPYSFRQQRLLLWHHHRFFHITGKGGYSGPGFMDCTLSPDRAKSWLRSLENWNSFPAIRLGK